VPCGASASYLFRRNCGSGKLIGIMTQADQARTEDVATVSVLLPRALLVLFPEADREIEMPARSVADVIAELDRRWPGMRDRLCDTTPRVRRHINIFVDGERATLATPLRDGVKVYVLTAISGG
jgi:molybdopterin converting factor small subunit